MNSQSWLINSLNHPSIPESTALQLGFLKTGSTIGNPTDPELLMPEMESSHLLDLLAEEVLLRISLDIPTPESVLKGVLDHRLFGDDFPPLCDFLGCKAALAVFPLGTLDESLPTVGHIWVFQASAERTYPDHREKLDGHSNVVDVLENRMVYVTMPDSSQSINGESWQLAFMMAVKALYNSSRMRECALNWLFTGRVRGERILEVGLFNKTELQTDRNLLIPRANYEVGVFSKKVKTVTSIDEALAWVSNTGIRSLGKSDWPDEVVELHSFTSAAISPVIAAAILSQPQRIVLWHSGNEEVSEKPAWAIFSMLRELLIDTDIKEPQLISSSNLSDVEKTLRNHFEGEDLSGRIVFNITQGNRLMALGPHFLARSDPAIWLVYRDNDLTDSLEYAAIHYKEGSSSPSTLLLARKDKPLNMRWEKVLPEGMHEDSWKDALLLLLSPKARLVYSCGQWKELIEEHTDR